MNKYCRLLVLGLAIMPFAAVGETYKCRAPSGKISYSGQMSSERGVKCEPMFVKKPPISQAEIPPAVESLPGKAGILQPGQPPVPADAAKLKPATPQKTPADLELDAKRKKQEAEEAKKKADKANEDKQAEQKIKAENCKAAKANLQIYQIGGRISKIDEKGERVYLDDNEIKRKMDEAKQEVSRWCGS